ncbi:MAG: hypothetical protein ACRDD2_10600 [Sarcina sp.]
MAVNEQSLDLKLKGIGLRAYFTVQNEEVTLTRLIKLPMLKELVSNNEGNYVIIDIHDNKTMIMIRRVTIIDEIKKNLK